MRPECEVLTIGRAIAALLYVNPTTEIRLTRWHESGAHIRLSDHRYR